ncbi:MAG TPA: flippase [Bacilli bacterium]|nr:flippase [Bacilli bacterium]
MIKELLRNKVANNARWLIGSKIIQAVLGLVISMISARYLGPSNYGIINYAASIATFFWPIASLGFTNILVQEEVNNSDKEGKIFGTAMSLSLISSIFCIVGIFAFTSIANAGETVTIVVCMLYSIILIARVCEMIVYWFQAKLLAKYSSIISLVAYIAVSVYRIFLLVTNKSIYWFAVASCIDYFIIAIFSYCVYRKKGGQRLGFDWQIGKAMFSKSKHYIISSLMITIYTQIDKIMINQMMDDANVGFYSAAVACAGLFHFVFSALIDSFRPLIFEKMKSNDTDGFELNVKRLYSFIIYLCLAQCVCMTLFAKWIVLLLYGNDYAASINVLRLVVWFTTFSYLGSVRNVWILAKNQQKYLWFINLLGALSNVFMNYILITFMGIMGAALASIITQFFTNVVIGWIITPLRNNNRLMIQALNPKYILNILKKGADSEE